LLGYNKHKFKFRKSIKFKMTSYHNIVFTVVSEEQFNHNAILEEDGLWYDSIVLNLYEGTLIYIDQFAQSLYNENKPLYVNVRKMGDNE